jgi:organic hydroperoxide reductase OsmC/OhrA
MNNNQHQYELTITWTGNTGNGTETYTAYERSHTVNVVNKAEILASSDAAFRGDKTRHNPEEMLLASLSSCHMLWYLHLCATEGVIVTAYTDHATAVLQLTDNGGGYIAAATINPVVTVLRADMITKANALHSKANELCFIANSVNFKVEHCASCVANEA